MYSRVAEFQRAFGQYIADAPGFPDQACRALRVKLLAEEAQEFADAYKASDIVEMADALADILYIAYGTALSYGFEPVLPVAEAKRFPSVHIKEFAAIYVRGLMERYEGAEEKNDFVLVKDLVARIIQLSHDISDALDIPIEEVFAEVHASNMSKLGADGKPIYREDGKVLKGPAYFRPNIARILGEA